MENPLRAPSVASSAKSTSRDIWWNFVIVVPLKTPRTVRSVKSRKLACARNLSGFRDVACSRIRSNLVKGEKEKWYDWFHRHGILLCGETCFCDSCYQWSLLIVRSRQRSGLIQAGAFVNIAIFVDDSATSYEPCFTHTIKREKLWCEQLFENSDLREGTDDDEHEIKRERIWYRFVVDKGLNSLTSEP